MREIITGSDQSQEMPLDTLAQQARGKLEDLRRDYSRKKQEAVQGSRQQRIIHRALIKANLIRKIGSSPAIREYLDRTGREISVQSNRFRSVLYGNIILDSIGLRLFYIPSWQSACMAMRYGNEIDLHVIWRSDKNVVRALANLTSKQIFDSISRSLR